MGCCGGNGRRNIPKAYFRLFFHRVHKSEVDRRLKICLDCKQHKWFLGFLVCGKCYCFLPAKAHSGTCPELHW